MIGLIYSGMGRPTMYLIWDPLFISSLGLSVPRPRRGEEERGGLCWEWRLSSQRDSMAPPKKGKKPKRKPRDRSKLSEKSNPHLELKAGDTEWWYAFWHKNGGATGTLETSSRCFFFFSFLDL